MASRTALIALGLLWIAMLVAGGAQSGFDPALLDLLYAGGHPMLVTAAATLTEMGGWRVLIPVGMAAVTMLLLQGEYRRCALLIAIMLMARLAVDLQKLAIARVRPDLHEPLVQTISSSFPSGHSANATITYLAIAVLVGRRRPWIALAAALAVTIGISRVMLGVHWPSDVVGGWSFGLLWVIALLRLFGHKPAVIPATASGKPEAD